MTNYYYHFCGIIIIVACMKYNSSALVHVVLWKMQVSGVYPIFTVLLVLMQMCVL